MTQRAGRSVAAVLVVCLAATGCSRTVAGTPLAAGDRDADGSARSLTPSELDRLLLSDGQISTIMGVDKMKTYRAYTGVPVQPDEVYRDPQCAGMLFNTTVPGYDGVDYVTSRGRKIDVSGRGSSDQTDEVDEAVVAFETASEATKFVQASEVQWHSCSGKKTVYTGTDREVHPWRLGMPRKVGEIIAVNNQTPDGWQCGHAMAARANVVADVDACGYDIKDQAVTIVKAIITVAQ
ncbi:MAG: hypothetical protein QOH57_379 [Mycobacterium sp.]|jgi:serine/threonine-protein kinase|nr:hypothetical protein [Mycobacterium sp.]